MDPHSRHPNQTRREVEEKSEREKKELRDEHALELYRRERAAKDEKWDMRSDFAQEKKDIRADSVRAMEHMAYALNKVQSANNGATAELLAQAQEIRALRAEATELRQDQHVLLGAVNQLKCAIDEINRKATAGGDQIATRLNKLEKDFEEALE